ncbi:MAG: alanine racemase [Caldilineaceae bacterium]|nr:alanine racemase [Caldilineaceae bacterium]
MAERRRQTADGGPQTAADGSSPIPSPQSPTSAGDFSQAPNLALIPQSPVHNPQSSLHRPTWLEIDLHAIRTNVGLLRQQIGRERTLFAVVKANAYGHGATLVAPAALNAGVDRLAVAAVNEGIELRAAGIHAPILVMGYVPGWQAEDLARHDLTAALYDLEVAQEFSAVAQSLGRTITVHIKVDTGMRRLGLYPKDVAAFLQRLAELPALRVEGIYTHFSTADEADKSFSYRQIGEFVTLLEGLKTLGLCPPLVHSANSAATLSVAAAHFNGARCGISLYGLHPGAETSLPEGFLPALRWVARIAQIKHLKPGDTVSYGNTYIADQPRTLAVIPVGYADGFPRAPRTWGSLLIAGSLAPIRGRVCMDQSMVDITEIVAAGKDVRAGDEVVLLGAQGDARLSAEDVAAQLGTINYEVVSRLMARIPRIAINDEYA